MKKTNNRFILGLMLIAIIVTLLPMNFVNSRFTESKDLKIPGEVVSNNFDSQDKKIIFWDIDLMEDGFQEICTASEWQKGDVQEIKYYNNKYDFSLNFDHQTFSNDGLIEAPYIESATKDGFHTLSFVSPINEEASEFQYACYGHVGIVTGLDLHISEKESKYKIKATVLATEKQMITNEYELLNFINFKETEINNIPTLIYTSGGHIDRVNIIVFIGDYNYHFSMPFRENEEELLNIIKTLKFYK